LEPKLKGKNLKRKKKKQKRGGRKTSKPDRKGGHVKKSARHKPGAIIRQWGNAQTPAPG